MDSYDIIIVGAGAAGLLLADTLGADPHFHKDRILLLEKETKKENDRTWCFWEAGTGDFDPILHHSWAQLYIAGKDYSSVSAITPYRYKMLRSSEFYKTYTDRVRKYGNILYQQAEVVDIREQHDFVEVHTDAGIFRGEKVFTSRFDWDALIRNSRYPVLQQHFMGWFVRTDKPVFDPKTATFMDFSIAQRGNTRFMYLLPFGPHEALVEYTLFSEDLLEVAEYEEALENYLGELTGQGGYEILEKEKGRIPMSCYDFGSGNTKRIMTIGMAGGWAKPSTGFTFYNTCRQVAALAEHLKAGKDLTNFGARNRFWWYDLLLLDILHRENHKGREIFESLFRKRDLRLVLKFLEEQTTVWEDLWVIMACPKGEFIRALFRRLFRPPASSRSG